MALILNVLLAFVFSFQAVASEDEEIKILAPATELTTKSPLSPAEIYSRTQAVLAHFQVPEQTGDSTYLSTMGPVFSTGALERRLAFMDPFHIFASFFRLQGAELSLFKDSGSQSLLDFTFNLNQAPARPGLRDRILAAQKNSPGQILKGLRVALDPGHMGGSLWDRRTGKFVSDGKNRISEGLINLQVCLLLKKDLQALGATVLVTHESLAPVSTVDADHFELSPWAREELRFHAMDPWFLNLLPSAPVGPVLFDHFAKSSAFRELFSEKMRDTYFIKRVDLNARVDLMSQFQPDMTIYIHHDTGGDAGVSASSPSKTRAFLPGSFQATELADTRSRQFLTRHWLDEEAWDLSLQLIRKTLGQVKMRMGIPLAVSDGDESVKVEDGIFSRNLLVPRKMKNTITAYYELFFYDRTEEFKALLDTRYPMTIDGVSAPYSERLRLSAESLREGIVEFIKTAH